MTTLKLEAVPTTVSGSRTDETLVENIAVGARVGSDDGISGATMSMLETASALADGSTTAVGAALDPEVAPTGAHPASEMASMAANTESLVAHGRTTGPRISSSANPRRTSRSRRPDDALELALLHRAKDGRDFA
jgi:hypothetical protein